MEAVLKGMRSNSSQRDIAIHLTRGHSITPLEALGVFKVFRLASVIERLRGRGMPIITRICEDAKGRQYASYSLARIGDSVLVKHNGKRGVITDFDLYTGAIKVRTLDERIGFFYSPTELS